MTSISPEMVWSSIQRLSH